MHRHTQTYTPTYTYFVVLVKYLLLNISSNIIAHAHIKEGYTKSLVWLACYFNTVTWLPSWDMLLRYKSLLLLDRIGWIRVVFLIFFPLKIFPYHTYIPSQFLASQNEDISLTRPPSLPISGNCKLIKWRYPLEQTVPCSFSDVSKSWSLKGPDTVPMWQASQQKESSIFWTKDW